MTATITPKQTRTVASQAAGRFNGYPVRLPIFEGPLDLLLYLVKENRYDLFDIPIAAITDQYLRYLRLMEMLDLDIAGEFLVMAATLMVMKSRLLLPPEEDETTEEAEPEVDPQEELARRLLEYAKYRAASESLRTAGDLRAQMFERPPDGKANGRLSDVPLMRHFSTFDLLRGV
ncbi:MAG: segregation/condensation protein A, partial [Abditibacteriales bacterium]|nr:segregation/condensation protein A [Abditibacteriales bacterium]MDW8367809.1 segregation/condensation protein A [Abditibacteriales bacterium]